MNVAAKVGSDDVMELPHEKDSTILLSTIQAQFPSAIGLKYKSSSGGWRGIRAENNILSPPCEGWGDDVYIVTESDALKRKPDEESRSSSYERTKRRKNRKLLEDLIVLGLPFSTTQEELSEFFTEKCGELDFCELKYDRDTKKSRGFGFIRFKSVESAEEALKGYHEIDGRKLEVRLSKKKDEVPMKLFVGRLAKDTTKEDVSDYFTEYGDLVDVFVPSNPFRGFAFITFSDQEDAMKVLAERRGHKLKGAELNVTAAQPKEDKGPLRQENFGVVTHGNGSSFHHGVQGDGGYGGAPHYPPPPPTPPQMGSSSSNIVSDLKDMLRQVIAAEQIR